MPQAGHHHQQRGFTAAAGADENDEPSRLDLERHVGHRKHILPRSLVDLANAGELNRTGTRGRLQRRYVRQWLHRVSTHLTSSLKAIAMAAIISTPASNCF